MVAACAVPLFWLLVNGDARCFQIFHCAVCAVSVDGKHLVELIARYQRHVMLTTLVLVHHQKAQGNGFSLFCGFPLLRHAPSCPEESRFHG